MGVVQKDKGLAGSCGKPGQSTREDARGTCGTTSGYDMAAKPLLAAGTVTVETTNPGVVSFGSGGRIVFVANGNTDIHYTAYNGVWRTLRLNAVDPPKGITLSTKGPALLCSAPYEIHDTNDDENILARYDFLRKNLSLRFQEDNRPAA